MGRASRWEDLPHAQPLLFKTNYWNGPQVSPVDAIYSRDCSKQWKQRRKGMQSYWKRVLVGQVSRITHRCGWQAGNVCRTHRFLRRGVIALCMRRQQN